VVFVSTPLKETYSICLNGIDMIEDRNKKLSIKGEKVCKRIPFVPVEDAKIAEVA
jgi:hypothetical protein